MFHLPIEIADVVADHHGIVTMHQLRAAGVPDHRIRRAVTAGSIVRVHVGTYRVATSPPTFEARCVAACLADDEAVITGPAAARLWGFRHVWVADEPIVMVAHDRRPLQRGVQVRRTNRLDRSDWVNRTDGIRVASPPRAWFDCARDLDDRRFEKLTEWVLDHHASVPTLWAIRARLNQKGRPGLARVNRVLSQRAVWQRPAGSGLEVDVFRALAERGIQLVQQHPIPLPDGSLVHPDGAIPDHRWALEIDHVTWHGGRFDAQRDKGRDRRLRRVGWQVDRITDQELRDDFGSTIDEIAELIALRASSLTAA